MSAPRGRTSSPAGRCASSPAACSPIVTLAALDTAGLALGLYAALVLRSLAFGDEILWNLLWNAGPAEWLPFLIPITLLVFWQAGLYARRERRAGFGRVVSSLLLVAAITLAFGIGTGYDFTTSGLIPTACVTSALLIGGLRAAYDSLTLELQRLLHVRRRVLLVGGGEGLAKLHRLLSASGRLVAYEFVGAFEPGQDSSLEERLNRMRPDELILNEGDLDEETLLDLVETAHRAGVRVRIAPTTTDLLRAARRVRPGTGRAALRAPPARARRHRLVRQEIFDFGVSLLVLLIGLAAVGADRARDQARLARPRPLPGPARRRRRAGVRDAQVPDDGRGRRRAAARARGSQRGRRRPVQDPRRPSRDARRAGAAPALARRGAAAPERPPRRDEPRRPAPAALCATSPSSSRGTASATTSCRASPASGRSPAAPT